MKKKVHMDVLSIKEEKNLSQTELIQYYKKLRDYCSNRKLEVTTRGALTIAPKLKKLTEKIVKWLTPILAGGPVSKVVEGLENIPDGPVIFASTHQGMLDNFIWIEDCPKHAVVVHGAEVNKFLLMAQFNTGLVLVTKDKSKSEKRLHSKLDMMSILLKGHSIFIFPESTWNLSPNKLHLPTYCGFVDIAKKTGAPIVPVTMNYVYDTSKPKERITHIQIKYAKPIYVQENDDIQSKLYEYSESISTTRWEMIEQQGLCERSSITNNDYINYLKGNLANLKLAKLDVNRERAGIYGANDEFYMFHHINDVPFDDRGNLL